MSRSVDLFVASDQPAADLATDIATRAGLTADPSPDGERYELTAGGITAVLHRHQYLDDAELPLGRYPYALSIRTQATGHLGLTPEVGLLRRVAAALEHLPVLLVLDLQNRDTPPPPVSPSGSAPPPAAAFPAPGFPATDAAEAAEPADGPSESAAADRSEAAAVDPSESAAADQ